jgi:putative ABC transport system permease protein
MKAVFQDIRYGARMLRKSPGFAIAAIVTLALGIGANTAIFSVIEGILLRPLPFEHSDRLFMVWTKQEQQNGVRVGASGPDFQDYKDQSHSFEYIAELLPRFTYTWTGVPEPKQLICTGISYDFFPMLGVHPLLGRLYTSDEYHVDGVEVVISERFWRQQLGADPQIIGRVLHLDATSQTVIGVMPTMPDLFPDTDVWAKVVPDFAWMRLRSNKFLTVMGRLKPGVDLRQAQQELTTILGRAPGKPRGESIELVPLKDELVGKSRNQLELIMAAVGVVLLITDLNVICLLLGRASQRQTEIAVRLGLGASRARILWQLVVENLVLSLFAGALGIGLALIGVQWFKSLNLAGLPQSAAIHVNFAVLCFALLITVLTALVLAWVPSSAFSRLNLNSVLRMGRSEVGGTSKRRLQGLVVSEICFAIVLLVNASLLLRSLQQLEHSDPGFQPDHLLTAYLRTNYYTPAGAIFYRDVLDRVSGLPGVTAAAVSDCLPGIWTHNAALDFDDRPSDPSNKPKAASCWTSADFFRASGTPLLTGRMFTTQDNADSPPTVIINQALAHLYWPGERAIGKHIGVNYIGPGRHSDATPQMREIVGVVGDVRENGVDRPVEPAVYLPFLQDPTSHVFAGMNLMVRTPQFPAGLAEAIRQQVHAVNPDQPIDTIQTMDNVLWNVLAPRRLSALLLGSFAALALVLETVGLYGAIAYLTSQRTREFGMRMALGGQFSDILGLVMKEGLLLAVAGVAGGIFLSLLSTRALSAVLFGVTSTDPLTFVSVTLLILITSAGAVYFPARRAAKVDPLVVLRYE